MVDALPRTVKPRDLSAREASLDGTVALERCPRLAALVVADGSSVVSATLHFGPNGAGQPACTGVVEVELMLQCQRCLEPVPTAVAGEVKAEFVRGEEDARADGFEAVKLDEETLALSDLIEDEILLALPFAPVHEEACAAAPQRDDGDDVTDESDERSAGQPGRVMPFANLRELMNERDDTSD